MATVQLTITTSVKSGHASVFIGGKFVGLDNQGNGLDSVANPPSGHSYTVTLLGQPGDQGDWKIESPDKVTGSGTLLIKGQRRTTTGKSSVSTTASGSASCRSSAPPRSARNSPMTWPPRRRRSIFRSTSYPTTKAICLAVCASGTAPTTRRSSLEFLSLPPSPFFTEEMGRRLDLTPARGDQNLEDAMVEALFDRAGLGYRRQPLSGQGRRHERLPLLLVTGLR